MHVYQLQVHTGDVSEADTEADVFVTMFGERGDSGRRRLFKSKSSGKPFTREKVGPGERLVKVKGKGWSRGKVG